MVPTMVMSPHVYMTQQLFNKTCVMIYIAKLVLGNTFMLCWHKITLVRRTLKSRAKKGPTKIPGKKISFGVIKQSVHNNQLI